MIALLLALQTAPPASEAEIVVTAAKFRLIEVDLKAPRRNGKLELQRCRVTKPAGIAELDAIPCEVAQACMVDAPTSRKQLEACVEERSQSRLDAVVTAWRTRL